MNTIKVFFLFYRKVFCAMTTFPAGLYHFCECYNCEFIISVDQGKYFYSKTFLNCIKIEIYYQMLNPKNLKNLYFFPDIFSNDFFSYIKDDKCSNCGK